MKKKNTINRTNFKPLDSFEERLMKDIDKGVFVKSKNQDISKNFFKKAVKTYKSLQGSKRITIRINTMDLINLKAKAKAQGMPYQTLMNTILKKYIAVENLSNLRG